MLDLLKSTGTLRKAPLTPQEDNESAAALSVWKAPLFLPPFHSCQTRDERPGGCHMPGTSWSTGCIRGQRSSSTTQGENKTGGAGEGLLMAQQQWRSTAPHPQLMGSPLWGDRSWLHSVVLWSDAKRRRQHYLNEEPIYSYINTNVYTSKYLQLNAFVNHRAAFSLQNIAGDFNS